MLENTINVLSATMNAFYLFVTLHVNGCVGLVIVAEIVWMVLVKYARLQK